MMMGAAAGVVGGVAVGYMLGGGIGHHDFGHHDFGHHGFGHDFDNHSFGHHDGGFGGWGSGHSWSSGGSFECD